MDGMEYKMNSKTSKHLIEIKRKFCSTNNSRLQIISTEKFGK